MKTLAIIGAGHLGQQIAHYAISDNHYDNIVFFDDYATVSHLNGYPILGNTADVLSAYDNNIFNDLIIGIGYKHLPVRKQFYEHFYGLIPFGTIIHSTTWVDPTAKIGDGCVIYPTCAIDAHTVIESNTILNIGCTIAHDTNIGKHCFLSPRVALAGFIKIEELCILGISATVIDNISIAASTQLGGGTIVIENINIPGLYVGNPQRFIKKKS